MQRCQLVCILLASTSYYSSTTSYSSSSIHIFILWIIFILRMHTTQQLATEYLAMILRYLFSASNFGSLTPRVVLDSYYQLLNFLSILVVCAYQLCIVGQGTYPLDLSGASSSSKISTYYYYQIYSPCKQKRSLHDVRTVRAYYTLKGPTSRLVFSCNFNLISRVSPSPAALRPSVRRAIHKKMDCSKNTKMPDTYIIFQ